MLLLYTFLLFLLGSAAMLWAAWWWGYAQTQCLLQPRTIVCPETLQAAEVRVDRRLAARSLLSGHEEMRVAGCSRWPEKAGCDRACEVQLPLAGDDRSFTRYAPGGLPAEFLRVVRPAQIGESLYRRINAQARRSA